MAYKRDGAAAQLNFELPAERRANLDAMSFEDLIKTFHSPNAHFARGVSHHRGVNWSKSNGKWAARASLGDGKRRFLGYYNSEIEAALAYDAAVRTALGA